MKSMENSMEICMEYDKNSYRISMEFLWKKLKNSTIIFPHKSMELSMEFSKEIP
jgi:hypothetical protein